MSDNTIPSSAASTGPEALWRIAADPERVEALHGMVGDFCHLLRNRLNSLKMGLYLARRECDPGDGATWDDLDGYYREAERVIELFQTICRPMPLSTVTIGLDLVLGEFASRWSPRFARRGVSLDVSVSEGDRPSCVDPCRLATGLDALATWRVDRARPGSVARLIGHVRPRRSRVEWSEDGPLAGLEDGALPLGALARIASAHGGSMTHDDHDGWRLRLDWPHPEPPEAA